MRGTALPHLALGASAGVLALIGFRSAAAPAAVRILLVVALGGALGAALHLSDRRLVGAASLLVDVDGGAARLAAPDPDHLVAAVAGLVPGGRVVLDREVLGADPPDRWGAGLATAICALPPAWDVPILELVALGASVPVRGSGVLLATGRSRTETSTGAGDGH